MPTARTIAPTANTEIWWLTGLLGLAFAALTAGDIAITQYVLEHGLGTEFNPSARDGDGLHVTFLIVSNLAVLLPLTGAFFMALHRARDVPPDTLARWWTHIFRITRPFSQIARRRAPLRLASAALTILAFKTVVVAGNVMGVLGLPSLLDEVGRSFMLAGVSQHNAYYAAYAAVIIPCYVAGAGLSAALLRQVAAVRETQR